MILERLNMNNFKVTIPTDSQINMIKQLINSPYGDIGYDLSLINALMQILCVAGCFEYDEFSHSVRYRLDKHS